MLVVLVVRCLTNVATVAGSGVGGLFIPLVVAGALLGRVAQASAAATNSPCSSSSASPRLLGAGYRASRWRR